MGDGGPLTHGAHDGVVGAMGGDGVVASVAFLLLEGDTHGVGKGKVGVTVGELSIPKEKADIADF